MPHHQNVIVNCYTAQEAAELCSRTGVYKANTRIDKMFVNGVLAGMILAFACAATLSTNTAPWFQTYAPGLIRMIGAIIFPFGLTIIVVTGADLCTGSFMYTTMAALHRRISVPKMLMHWAVTFFGNLAGSLFIMAILIGYGEIFSTGDFKTEALNFANKKAVSPTWATILVRGIGANWLVCMACYLAFMAREFFSKVIAIWWPTFAFVCLGFDHVVANMFFIPIAIFLGDGEISVGYYIWKSMIPALIGNIIGGGFFVGTVYWYMYLAGEAPIAVDGLIYETRDTLVGQSVDAESLDPKSRAASTAKSAEAMV